MPDKNNIEFFIFDFLTGIFRLLGFYNARKTAGIFAFIFYYIIPIRKKVVLENLKIAFPKKTLKERKRLAYLNYKSFLITFIEITCAADLSQDEIEDLVNCDLETIRKVYSKNQGLIFLTAHFGNWEITGLSVASQLGIPFSVLAKPMRNNLVNDVLDRSRELLGNKVIKLGASVREIYKEIKEKKIVALVGDQRGPKEGMRVKFFGRDTAVYSGTAAIALKTGAPILVGMIIRQPDYSYIVEFTEIDHSILKGKEEEKIFQINQKYMSILEQAVCKHPEQWFWMHNIWKY